MLHTAGTWDDHYFGVSRQPGERDLGWRCPVASAYVTQNFYNRCRSPEVVAVEDAEAGPQVSRHVAQPVLATKKPLSKRAPGYDNVTLLAGVGKK